jgi:hypothetical protein
MGISDYKKHRNEARLNADIRGVSFLLVSDNVFSMAGSMYGISLNILKAQAGFQISGAFKLDLSGVAKMTSSLGGAASGVMNSQQAIVDLALRLLNGADEMLVDLEDSIISGPFADGVDTARRLLNRTQDFLGSVNTTRVLSTVGQAALSVAKRAGAVGELAGSVVDVLQLAAAPDSPVAVALDVAVRDLQAVLRAVQLNNNTLREARVGLLAPITEATRAEWSQALVSTLDLSAASTSLLAVAAQAINAAPAVAVQVVDPVSSTAFELSRADVLDFEGLQYAVGNVTQLVTAALAAFTSGSAPKDLVAVVETMLPKLETYRDVVHRWAPQFTGLAQVAVNVSHLTESLQGYHASLCGPEVWDVAARVGPVANLLAASGSPSAALSALLRPC